MSHPQIIIPFSLPPAEHAKDLVKLLASMCATDGLAMLLARAHSAQRQRFDDFAAALPHEVWLSEQHNPLRHLVSKFNLTLTDGYWFILNPVNLHIASNHLVLTDYRQLELQEVEARALFSRAEILSRELGLELIYGDAGNWLLRADDWSELQTTTPDAACGHNIEIWSPKGPTALAWRKLQNEIQMDWFIHPVQEQRQLRAARVVNGLWLWSGTQIDSSKPAASAVNIQINPDVQHALQSPDITILDQLIPLALAGDWAGWAQAMQELETSWFKPLCDAMRSGTLRQVDLILCNSNTLLSLDIRPNSLRRFWRRANFNQLG